jgi:hypothetical protein
MTIFYCLKFETPPGSCIHFAQEHGSPVIPPGIGFVWFIYILLYDISKVLYTHYIYTRPLSVQVQVQVQVILRLMVSRPVHLSVLLILERVTRCYISLSDNYFFIFSCKAPSLTRRRVCNLQCNDACSISSYIATDGLSASSSWCRSPNGAHDHFLISLFDNYFLSSRCRAPSHISPMKRVGDPARSQSHVRVGQNF